MLFSRYSLLAVLLVALAAVEVHADGCYFPEVAYKKIPAMPKQRALLFYRDGSERLVIEAALDAEGQAFGWVIPLPAKPTKFEKASPGFLKTLSFNIRPRITHDLSRQVESWYVIAVAIGFWAVMISLARFRSRILPFVLLAVFLFVGLLAMPRMGREAKDGGPPESGEVIEGIVVEQTVTIGSYELSVLKADTAEALDAWLRANGFSLLPEEGKSIVSSYVKEGWRFVAAKLRRQGDGLSIPHPLAMTFPAEKPVYPMKLTSLAGSALYLELFVVADRKAVCDGLNLEFCDTYHYKEVESYGHIAKFMSGSAYQRSLGHPVALEAMWDGCTLTKLSGEFQPKDMTEDIVLRFRSPRPYWQHFYSEKGAQGTGSIVAFVLWIIGLPLVLLIPYGRVIGKRLRGFAALAVVLPVAIFCLLVYGIVYLVLPKTEVTTERGGYWRYYDLQRTVNAITEERGCFPNNTLAEVTAEFDDYFRHLFIKNRLAGERIKCEDSPGNYRILEDKRGIVFRIYGRNGGPVDTVVSLAGIVKACVPLLKGERKPYNELAWLGMTRDPRTVKPILDSMKYWLDRKYRIATEPLRKITGFDFDNDYDKWSKWWEENKGKSRVEWLRAAIKQREKGNPTWAAVAAARELAYLGDGSGTEILLDALHRWHRWDYEKFEITIALARLEEAEGLQRLESMLEQFNNLGRFWDKEIVLLGIYRKHAGRFVPALLRRLKNIKGLRAEAGRDRWLSKHVEHYVTLLAGLMEVIPPSDVSDDEAVNAFIAEAETWRAPVPALSTEPAQPGH